MCKKATFLSLSKQGFNLFLKLKESDGQTTAIRLPKREAGRDVSSRPASFIAFGNDIDQICPKSSETIENRFKGRLRFSNIILKSLLFLSDHAKRNME
jgi:hypothetical protein